MLTLDAVTVDTRHDALRQEVRSFLRHERAGGRFVPVTDNWLAGWDPGFSERLGERGWIGMTFPIEYGGSAQGALARFVVTEELLAAGAPVAAHWIADRQSGPALLSFGTPEQKRAYLPEIAKGRLFMAIGMSEADSGSDLASVRTRARPVPGGWRVDGHKLWTSGAHHAHAMIALVRTSSPGEARHAGLTQLLVDLQAPGVEIHPIRLMTGEHHFNEVVLNDVFVAQERVLGEVGNGWHQVMSELAFERSGPERILSTYPLLAAAVVRLQQQGAGRGRADLGMLVARLAALRQLSLAVTARLAEGGVPATEAALVKLLGTRFEQLVVEVVRACLPCEPYLASPDPVSRMLAESILHSPGFTLRGGTTEILQGLVARSLQASSK